VTDNKAYDTHKSFLSKATFEGKLSFVTYTVAQICTCRSQLSKI